MSFLRKTSHCLVNVSGKALAAGSLRDLPAASALPLRVCRHHRRNGSATLELVLSMPILLALIVGIVWLGSSVIAQTEVTIEARYRTWSERDQPTGKALLFLKDDIASEKATGKVKVSPIFDDAEPPESSHDVMIGSWDHEKLPLNKAPNWKQYAIAAINAKTGSLQTSYVDASNKLTRFKNIAGNIWKSLGADLIRQLTNLGDSVSSLLKNGESAEQGEKAKEQAKINRQLEAKKQELQTAEQELKDLDDDASETLKSVLENRVKRLKAEVENLKSDLKEMD